MAFATVQSWSETPGSNTEIDGINIDEGCNPSGINNAIREAMAQIAAWTGDDTIASATTTDLSTVNGQYVTISGTTTITGFGTVKAGWVKFLHFAGALTLTHNATSLILPGGNNITTVAGDTAAFVSLGSGNWRCLVPPGYISLSAANTWTATQTFTSTDAGITGPTVILYHNSASPAVGDNAGVITVNAEDSNGNAYTYTKLVTELTNVTAGSQAARFLLQTNVAGVVNNALIVHSGGIQVPDGTVSAPSIAPASDTNTGIYALSADSLGFTMGGTHIGHLNSTGWTVSNTSGSTTFGSVDAVKNLISGGGQIDVTNTQSGSACRLSRTTDGNVIQYHKAATLRGSHSVNDTGTTFNNTSDGNLKIDRVPLSEELDLDAIYEALEPLAYTMLNSDTLRPIDGRLFGFVAQDVYAIKPLRHLVTVGHGKPGDKDYSPWMLNYVDLQTVLFACVRHRQKKIEARLDAAGL